MVFAAVACSSGCRLSDNELGLFLRTRREAVTPPRPACPPVRRRTPGLRRAELAMPADERAHRLPRPGPGSRRAGPRSSRGCSGPTPQVAAFADEPAFTAGGDFADRVRTLPGLPAATGVTRPAHPEAGALRLAYETLELPGDVGLRLIVHLPADGAAAAAPDRLTGRRPGALRAVSG
ncbi:hypothetical protein [Streptomyces sp. NPDC051310]|uniref:MmyB family transcriptional regulator n=1 Tax=Streptomyces sp. NPDC051310 TaxID=3365649 RepID=UPI0037A88B1C